MNNRNGKNNKNIFGSGFSFRRFLLETAPTLIENGNRTRNFDIERGQLEATRRERKYLNVVEGEDIGSGEGSYPSKSNKKNSFDSSKEPLTTNTPTGAIIINSNKIKNKKKLINNDQISSINIKSSLQSTSSSSSSSSWNNNGDDDDDDDDDDDGNEDDNYTKNNNKWFIEKNFCPICYTIPVRPNEFKELLICKHKICHRCLELYVKNEIHEFRTTIACPQCSEAIHPSDIEMILRYDKKIISKYEEYMIRKYLLADPDSRWCPAPDCGYAVIASGCASCPRIHCQRPGCGLLFCYHCKAEWHPDQTCDSARGIRYQQKQQKQQQHQQNPSKLNLTTNNLYNNITNNNIGNSELQLNSDDVKPCPHCNVLIVKMDDGSCNHMVCSICNAEFCWLCMKEISDLHYLSPSGCTFWGKKPWSRKKKIMWQLGTLIGAPVGIALVAGIAVPAMIIGIPVWIGKKIYMKYFKETRLKRNLAVVTSVLASFIISPVLAGLAVAVGIPILLFYVYGVVPISLCRTSCNVTTSRDGLHFDFDDDTLSLAATDNDQDEIISNRNEIMKTTTTAATTTAIENDKNVKEKLLDPNGCSSNSSDINIIIDCVSGKSKSIDDVSISVGNLSNIGSDVTENCNDEKCSDQDSTKALAGSINTDNGSCTSSNENDGDGGGDSNSGCPASTIIVIDDDGSNGSDKKKSKDIDSIYSNNSNRMI